MKKEGINYNLLNFTFFIFIIFIFYKLNILNTIIEVITLILFSISISYIIYPLYKYINKKFNNIVSITISYLLIFILFIIFIYLIINKSNIINNILELFNNVLKFEKIFNNKFNINLDIEIYLEKIINYILNNSIFLIKNIFNYINKIIFIIILSICIILNIDNIKVIIYKFKYKDILYNINIKLRKYLIANTKILIIQFIEYTFLFLLIGHPNYLLLGILNSINTFIPFIGTLFTNIIAITTSSVISKRLLILTSIISIIMPQMDAYIITPKIYKNINKIPETLYISMIIIFGTIFGIYGIILTLPILIIIIEILKYKNIVKEI